MTNSYLYTGSGAYIKFHNHETKVPLAWNNSFIGMEQEFPYNETEVSCRETIKKDIRG